MTSQNILIWKFTKNELHVGYYYKVGQAPLKNATALFYHKVRHVLLQSQITF